MLLIPVRPVAEQKLATVKHTEKTDFLLLTKYVTSFI